MAQQAQDDFYRDEEALALDYAAAVNAEIKDLFAAGADIVQLDEPWMQQHPDKARRYGLKALDRALEGVTGTIAVHLCFGYAAVVHEKPTGYSFLRRARAGSKAQQISIEAAQPKLDLAVLQRSAVEDHHPRRDRSLPTRRSRRRRSWPSASAARSTYVPPERIVIAPDCGMKYLPRDVAFGKMKAMVDGAKIVRDELTGRASTPCMMRTKPPSAPTMSAACCVRAALKDARAQARDAARSPPSSFAAIEDREIEALIRKQEEVGLQVDHRRRIPPRLLADYDFLGSSSTASRPISGERKISSRACSRSR